jgi:hypothetical protein
MATDINPLTIRYAGAADAAEVAQLAELDTARLPGHEVLVAEMEGRIVAALALSNGAVAADPFRRTACAVDLLQLRARQLGRSRRRVRMPRLRRAALPV